MKYFILFFAAVLMTAFFGFIFSVYIFKIDSINEGIITAIGGGVGGGIAAVCMQYRKDKKLAAAKN